MSTDHRRRSRIRAAAPLATVFLLTAVCACTSTETVTSSHDPSPGEEPAAIAEAEPAEPAGDQDGPRYLIGAVEQTGVMHCPPPKYDTQWVGLTPQLGFVNIWNTDDQQIESMIGKPAIAEGRVAAPPPRPPLDVELKMCPEMQMRSDWIPGPHGMRMRRGSSPNISGFRVDSLRELTELKARIEGDTVLVEFANPVQSKLEDVEIVMHYEGCYGKPGSKSEVLDAGDLDAGGGVSHSFPTFAEHAGNATTVRGRPARHAAYSLRVEAKSEEAAFDLDVKLRVLGADVECPDDRGMK